MISVVGSSSRKNGAPRLFKVDVPSVDCFFSGTDDMFAALTVVRMRQAIVEAGLENTPSWLSDDSIDPVDLPLAKAVEMVLASIHTVLSKTGETR